MSGDVRVSTLICHRDVPMALRCLESLSQGVAGASLILHEDGTLTDKDVESLVRSLPVARVVRRPQADEFMRESLRRHPACAAARNSNVLMLKLFDVAMMGDGSDIRYCDTDILFFRRASGLFERTGDSVAAVFMRDSNHAYSARPWHLMGSEALRVPQFVNSGLFVFPRARFDLDFLEWLLSQERMRAIFAHIASWAEQTCWAALAYRVGCGLWDPECLAVVNEAWQPGKRTVAAHFVSSIRHRLAEFPRTAAALLWPEREPIQVPVGASRECSVLDLGASQLARRLRRTCGF